MRAMRDPERLRSSPGTDPALREALRVIGADAPSHAALSALADRSVQAARAGGVSTGSASSSLSLASLAGKVFLVCGAIAALAYAALQSPANEPAASRGVAKGSKPTERSGEAALPRAMASSPVTFERGAQRAEEPEREARAARSLAVPSVRAEQRAAGGVVERSVAVFDQHARSSNASRASRSSTPAGSRRGSASSVSRSGQARETRGDHAQAPASAPFERPAASELDLLEAAQQALGSSPERALALLERHADAYPKGSFAQEREVLRIEALARLRDLGALAASARAFLERYPRSPHRSRVEELSKDLR